MISTTFKQRKEKHYEKSYIAVMIAEQVDADLFEISTVVPYPDEYEACTETAKQEQKEDARPELSATVTAVTDWLDKIEILDEN